MNPSSDELLTPREVQVLDLLRENQRISQRGLAQRLGVALGLANALLKQLVQKGYVNVSQTDARNFAYLCTPKGLAQKSVRLLAHVENSFEFYQQARALIRTCMADLERSGAKRVGIYGKGGIGELVYVALKDLGLDSIVLVDREQAGTSWLGQPVLTSSQAAALSLDAVVVALPEPGEALLASLAKDLGCRVLRLQEVMA